MRHTFAKRKTKTKILDKNDQNLVKLIDTKRLFCIVVVILLRLLLVARVKFHKTIYILKTKNKRYVST